MKLQIRKILKEYVDRDSGALIKDYLNDEFGFYEDFFSVPYDDAGHIDVIIQYDVYKVNVWKSSEKDVNYEGTVFVRIEKLLIGDKNENFWEPIGDKDDLPDWIWDDFQDSITKICYKYFRASVDVDLVLPKYL
jgi:hypothetical protein